MNRLRKNAKNLHFWAFLAKTTILDSFWLKGAKREFFKPFQNCQCVGFIYIDFSSKNQTIPMNQSEEKWEKPHF